MLVLEFFTWWYGQGWASRFASIELRLTKVSHLFSLPILVRTLFAPWRRIVSYPGASLEDKLRALGDNLVSRCIGFSVRLLTLVTAGVLIGLIGLASVLEALVWPLLPLGIPALVILGVIG